MLNFARQNKARPVIHVTRAGDMDVKNQNAGGQSGRQVVDGE